MDRAGWVGGGGGMEKEGDCIPIARVSPPE